MTTTPHDVDAALAAAAAGLQSHFAGGADLEIQALDPAQASTMALPAGAYAVESVITNSTELGSVALIVTGLVTHVTGEVPSRDEAVGVWSPALSGAVTTLAEAFGEFDRGQVRVSDAVEVLIGAQEARVVGLFDEATPACLLLALPATVEAAQPQTTPDPTPERDHAPYQAQSEAAQRAAYEAAVAANPLPTPQFQPLAGGGAFAVDPRRIDLLRDVVMGVSVELGRTRLTIQEILGLTPGSIVELDRAAGAPVDVLVNGTLIAHGEVVVVDEEFAVRISEVVSPDPQNQVSA